MSGDVVTVRLFAAARSAAGVGEVQVAPAELGQVRQALVDRFPELDRVLPQCSFLVDGLRADDDAYVPAGATLDALPPFAGG